MTRVTTMVVMVVVQMVRMMMMLLLQVMTMLMAQAGIRRVPGTNDLRLRPMRQDIEDTKRFDPAIIGFPFPFIFLIRVLHRHHLQALQRLEVIVRGTSGCRSVAARPAVHLFLLLFVLLVVPERRDRVAAFASPAAGSSVRHPVLSVAGVIPVLVLRHRITWIGSSGAQTVGVIVPGGSQLVLRVGRRDHQRQRTGTAHGDLVLVVLNVSSTRRASARRPSVCRRAAHAAGRRGAGRYRCRRRHRVRFRHLRRAHAARMWEGAKLKSSRHSPGGFRQPVARPRQVGPSSTAHSFDNALYVRETVHGITTQFIESHSLA